MKEVSQKFSSLETFATVTRDRHSIYLKNINNYNVIHSPYLIHVGGGSPKELLSSFDHVNMEWFNLIFDFTDIAELSTYYQGWYYVHKDEAALFELMS